jgi:Na+/H+ antiporter NhaD/arsenite permease-like protein
MYTILLIIFIAGYICIAAEHIIKIDKAASAILTGVLCWILLLLGRETLLASQGEHVEYLANSISLLNHTLLEHVGEIAEILFFLMAAMTIVELIDVHRGFQVVTNGITTTSRARLLWIICGITFVFSAALDNLTTAIVMATLLKKLLTKKEDLWLFGGMVVIAANAGGAWSPIGDVTTIMLWAGGQITALNIVLEVFLPSLFCLLIPLIVLTARMNGHVEKPLQLKDRDDSDSVTRFEQRFVFWFGVGALLFVPIFKSITHLPPFMGMLFSLGFLWVATEIIHRNKHESTKADLSVSSVIRRIDTPSILFFLGILLAVASLQSAGILNDLAHLLDSVFSNIYLINIFIGLLSSIIDNVPLVAGAMGMYSLDTIPQDSSFWEFLAYCAGTGGSVLIIGSAAGIAVMGLLRIDFIWYLKKISWLALMGYFSGAAIYVLVNFLRPS